MSKGYSPPPVEKICVPKLTPSPFKVEPTTPRPSSSEPIIYINSDKPGSLVFMLECKEVLRIDADGGIFIHGKKSGDNVEAFNALSKFVGRCKT